MPLALSAIFPNLVVAFLASASVILGFYYISLLRGRSLSQGSRTSSAIILYLSSLSLK